MLPLLEQVLEKNPNTVKIVHKNFPLQNHQFAKLAALAAMAAQEQGKFWEFHDKIFENYAKLSVQKIDEIALELKLDMARFNQDRISPKIQEAVNRDLQDGAAAGVRGTPTLFVNGRLVKNRSPEGFQEMIDSELRKK